MKIISLNEKETLELGAKIAAKLKAGDILALEGDLGVGKSCLTKGIAAGLGITDIIDSPTFNIVKEYTGKELPFYHIDAYRLEFDDCNALGWLEDYFYRKGIVVVEWPSMIKPILPEHTKYINISLHLDNSRLICGDVL